MDDAGLLRRAGSCFEAQAKPGRGVSIQSFNANSPSREYIFGGGSRLLASEEASAGCGSGPGTPGTLTATAGTQTSVALIWPASTGVVDHYEVERRNGSGSYAVVATVPPATGTVTVTDTNGVIADTAYLYRVRAFDSANCPSPYSNVDLATTTIFTNDPLVAQVTTIQALHVTQLRTAVDAVRATASLNAATWTNPLDQVRAIHFSELRTRLNEALPSLGLSQIPTDPGIAQGNTVYAVQLQAVRDKVK